MHSKRFVQNGFPGFFVVAQICHQTWWVLDTVSGQSGEDDLAGSGLPAQGSLLDFRHSCMEGGGVGCPDLTSDVFQDGLAISICCRASHMGTHCARAKTPGGCHRIAIVK